MGTKKYSYLNNHKFLKLLDYKNRKLKKKESYKEVLKNSWFLTAIWHIFNGTNTNSIKTTNRRQIMRNWIKTQDYKDDWCMFMSKSSWKDLKSIDANKIEPEIAHLKNLNDIWISKNGKNARKILEKNNGQYPIKNKDNLTCMLGYWEDAKNYKVKKVVLFYPVLQAHDREKQIENLEKLVDMKKPPNSEEYPFHIGPRQQYLGKDKLT